MMFSSNHDKAIKKLMTASNTEAAERFLSSNMKIFHESYCHNALLATITGWANSAVELESFDWIAISCWSRQPVAGVRR